MPSLEAHRLRPRRLEIAMEVCDRVTLQFADGIDGDVWRGVERLALVRIVAFEHMDGHEALWMHALERSENLSLVVYRDIERRRPARHDLVDMLFFVGVDRNLAIHGGFE